MVLEALVLSQLQKFLTHIWKLSFTESANILNIWGGAYKMLPLLYAFFVLPLVGNFEMLCASRVVFMMGTAVFFISTLSPHPNTSHAKEIFIYIALPVSALGISAQQVSLVPFLEEQTDELPLKWLSTIIYIGFYLLWTILLSLSKLWSSHFAIMFLIGAAVIVFLVMLRHLYVKKTSQKINLGDVKLTFSKFPYVMLVHLIACGVVSSSGHTFFIEQANHLNPMIGNYEFNPRALVSLSIIAGAIFDILARYFFGAKRFACIRGGLLITTVFAALTCAAAAITEAQRLHVITTHNLLDKPLDDIPMSMFWMLPQFIFLAGIDSFLKVTFVEVCKAQVPKSTSRYIDLMSQGVTGLGYMFSALYVNMLRNSTSWFQYTLNDSRLDMYYWMLFLVAVPFPVGVILYVYKYYKPEQNAQAGEEEDLEEAASTRVAVPADSVNDLPI